MSLSEVVIEGTIKPDGTLELNEKPHLLLGPVTVVLRQESPPSRTQEGWWPLMQRLRAEREAAGYHFLNESEMEAHLQWLREDDRLDDLLRQAEGESQKPEQP